MSVVQRVSVGGFADEILVVLFRYLREPWRLAVCKAMHALLLAQNKPRLQVQIKVNHARFHASFAHNRGDRLLALLHQHCSRYEVQLVQLDRLQEQVRDMNLGRVLSLTPSLTELALTQTAMPRDSFAAILGELTALHTLRVAGNMAFLGSSDSLVLPTALTKLDVRDCYVTEFQLRKLIRSVDDSNFVLKFLDLSMNALDRTTLLPELLKKMTALQTLDISMTQIKGDYLVGVMSAICTGLHVLRLNGLPISDPRKETYPKKYTKAQVARRDASDKRYFEELCRFEALRELSLNGMYIGVHAGVLAEAVRVMPLLTRLDLSNAQMTYAGAQTIADSLIFMPFLVQLDSPKSRVSQRTKLVKLNLMGNDFALSHIIINARA